MRSTKRRILGTIAVIVGLAMFAAACGDDGETSTGNTSPQNNGTTATDAPSNDDQPVTGTIAGAGATFPMGFYEEAIVGFEDANPDATVTYAGGGSGNGRTQLQEQLVDFAGTDGLVKQADYEKFRGGDFLYFPTVVAPIAVVYNLDGVDELNLTPTVIAKIFQREITSWDDPEIAADNPGVDLSGSISVVHRSDGSGTTENFTKFLDHAVGKDGDGTWTLGSGSTVEWSPDTLAGEGSGGLAQLVKDTSGSIGYVDLSDAIATDLSYANIENKAGNFIEPTLEGASLSADGATINDDLTYDPLWADGDDAYPITSPTWIIVYVNQTDAVKGETVKAFLRFILTEGQEFAADIDYAPLPESLRSKAIAQLDKIVIP